MMNSQQLKSIIYDWRVILDRERINIKLKENTLIKVAQETTTDDGSLQLNSEEIDKENYDIGRPNTVFNNYADPRGLEISKDKISDKNNENTTSKNVIIAPLRQNSNSGSNNNYNINHSNDNVQTRLPQKHIDEIQTSNKKKLKKKVLPTDLRDQERNRLAMLCENSTFNIGSCKNKDCDVLPANNNHNSNYVHIMSAREKEIKRLADIFENSLPSQDRTAIQLTEQVTKPFNSTSGGVGNYVTIGCSNHQNSTNSLVCNSNSSTIPSVHGTTASDSSQVLSSNQFLSGVGEYDDKRKELIKQRKKDFCDYMHQARLQMRNSRPTTHNFCSNQVSVRDVTTQTVSGLNNPISGGDCAFQRPSYLQDNNDCFYSNNNFTRDNKTSKGTCTSVPVSPTRSDRSSSRSPNRTPRGRDLHRGVNYLPGSPFLSPTTPSRENPNIDSTVDVGTPSTHMKQYIYREELKKQIEERQRLEEERKEKEKREEEAMERRVREQQEKLRKQYEMEEAQRREYAMRRHIPDDMLRQRLAEADIRGIQCNYTGFMEQHLPTVLPCSSMAPFISPDDRPLPLPDKKDKHQQRNNSNTVMMTSAINNTNSITTVNDTEKTAEQGAIVLNKQPSKPINLNRSNSQNNKQIDPLIGVDLLADNNHGNINFTENKFSDPILKENNVDDNNIAGDLNNLIIDKNISNGGSISPAVPAVRTKLRLASQMKSIEDKWQVPAVEKTYIRPAALYGYRPQPVQLHTSNLNYDPVGSGNNRIDNHLMNNYEFQSTRSENVLTQLGSFRRQLQLEHMKLQEQLYNQQMGTIRTNQQNLKSPVATSKI